LRSQLRKMAMRTKPCVLCVTNHCYEGRERQGRRSRGEKAAEDARQSRGGRTRRARGRTAGRAPSQLEDEARKIARRWTHLADRLCPLAVCELRDDDEADEREGEVPRGDVVEGGEGREDDMALKEAVQVEVGHGCEGEAGGGAGRGGSGGDEEVRGAAGATRSGHACAGSLRRCTGLTKVRQAISSE